jgi:hypothetical protein
MGNDDDVEPFSSHSKQLANPLRLRVKLINAIGCVAFESKLENLTSTPSSSAIRSKLKIYKIININTK